jgi:hypothetical protein
LISLNNFREHSPSSKIRAEISASIIPLAIHDDPLLKQGSGGPSQKALGKLGLSETVESGRRRDRGRKINRL